MFNGILQCFEKTGVPFTTKNLGTVMVQLCLIHSFSLLSTMNLYLGFSVCDHISRSCMMQHHIF